MAKKIEKSTTLKLKCVKGQTATGQDVYTLLTFSKVNPDVTDDDMLAVGELIGNLQTLPVAAIGRQDSANLEME